MYTRRTEVKRGLFVKILQKVWFIIKHTTNDKEGYYIKINRLVI